MNVDETRARMNVDMARVGMNVDEAREGMNVKVGNETFDEAVNNDLHGPLLHVEHLSLVVELRGHMVDQDHRTLLMG
jgi:hypothetical protein